MRLEIGPVLWVVWEEQVCLKQVGNLSMGRVVLRAPLPIPLSLSLSPFLPSPLPSSSLLYHQLEGKVLWKAPGAPGA